MPTAREVSVEAQRPSMAAVPGDPKSTSLRELRQRFRQPPPLLPARLNHREVPRGRYYRSRESTAAGGMAYALLVQAGDQGSLGSARARAIGLAVRWIGASAIVQPGSRRYHRQGPPNLQSYRGPAPAH